MRFKALLRDVILPLGNKLNEGSKKGSAAGFRVGSLKKLLEVKGSTNISLLEYIIDRLIASDSDVRARVCSCVCGL